MNCKSFNGLPFIVGLCGFLYLSLRQAAFA
jgi:hypothetical protein